MGKQYWFEEPREEGHSVIKALARHIASQPVLDTAGDVVKALAQGAWDGISAPGRAAAGENVTLGDAWNTAGMVAAGGAPMRAPEDALRAGALRTGGKADEILDMLKTGRAAEVTDDMMAAADPQRLWAGYDLPMDEASRMARAQEMGFADQVHYHGASAPFDKFNPSKSGMQGPGVYVTQIAEDASEYAMGHGGSGQNGIEVMIPKGRYASDKILNDKTFQIMRRDRSPTYKDANAAAVEALIDDGYVGAAVENVRPSYFGMENPTGVVQRNVFDPRNIRSRFARFDPRLKHLANLSAGVGGVAAMTDVDAEKAAIQAYLDKWK